MTDPIVADAGDVLPTLWRVEQALTTLALLLRDRHRATCDLLVAYSCPPEAADRLETLLGDDRAALIHAANELRRLRHRLSKVLP